ncbi:phenylalanine--tRNA ligase subunit beta [Candidatus Woesearchaeota archaeon]|nr:phenylalanine--tRNA ligase subunit beta [Candidatus Woesearchaeota archaeon]
MPTVTLNRKYLEKLIGKKLSEDELKDRISMLGTDLEEVNDTEVIVEVFPNRPDLLSEQGFGRALAAFVGTKPGLKEYTVEKSGFSTTNTTPLPYWPYVVTAMVKGLSFDDEKIRQVIQLQEKLGVTLLRRRKKGGLGLYPLDKITLPITFTSEVPEKIRYRPLEYPRVISGREILEKHPTGREYAHLCRDWPKFPLFIDASGVIMSMPPIINSHDVGKITEQTNDVFIEATGTDLKTLKVALNILVTALADMGGKIYAMQINQGTEKFHTPELSARKVSVEVAEVNKFLGISLKENDIKTLLARMGFGYDTHGHVLVPAYRDDILHHMDLVEDIAIAYGYENLNEEIPKVATIGKEAHSERCTSMIANLLIGFGCIEIKTYHITSEEQQCKKMNMAMDVVPLANATTEEYNVLRSWLLPNSLHVLNQNLHNDYPQKIFDIGTVFLKDKHTETGIKEVTRLCMTTCHAKADFTEIKQILNALMHTLDLTYEIEPEDHPSFIPGRVGRVKVMKEKQSKKIAYIGEIHPLVLENWSIPVPVASVEINLTELYTLLYEKED